MRTPASVIRLAMRSSPVSARLPSIAIEPVDQAAQTLSASRPSATRTLATAARVASDELDAIAEQAGLAVAHRWLDTDRWFAELRWA